MAKHLYRVRNWREYNQALTQRGSLTLWFSADVLSAWLCSSRTHERGRPRHYSDLAIQCALTLRQLYRLPLRATSGLVQSLLQLLNVNLKTPDYTTLCRRGKTLLFDLGPLPRSQARHVLVDSTGVRVCGEGEWKRLIHGTHRHRLWRKLHIAMDDKAQLILSACVTESMRLDGNYLPQLIDAIAGPIGQITGDGAYDKKSCYRSAYARHAKPIFPPQHDAIVQRNKFKTDQALAARDEVIRLLGKGIRRKARLKRWKRDNHYHRRSLIESMMWRMKSIFGDEMRSRTMENQTTDLLLRCAAMNRFTKLGLPHSVAMIA